MITAGNSGFLRKYPLPITVYYTGFPAQTKYDRTTAESKNSCLTYKVEKLNTIGAGQHTDQHHNRMLSGIVDQ